VRLKKGKLTMFGASLSRNLFAVLASLALSAVAVGAAVSPAQAVVIQVAGVAHG
jgi:hypothetical protein